MLFFLVAALSPAEIQDRILAAPEYSQVALSPDGKHAAWTEALSDKNGDDKFSAVWLGAPGEKPTRVTAGKDREASPAWSLDGKTLAFVAYDEGAEIFLWTGGQATRLLAPGGQAQALKFSSDGKQLLFLSAQTKNLVGAYEAAAVDKGVVNEVEPEQRLGAIDLASGKVRWLTPEDYFVYEFDERASTIAMLGVQGSGMANYWLAELATCTVANGAAAKCSPKELWQPQLQLAWPRVSPDGKNVAVIHGLMSDQGSNGGDLEIVNVRDGTQRKFLTTIALSVTSEEWRDNDTLVFAATTDSDSLIAEQHLNAPHEKILWRAGEELSSFSLQGDNSAVIRSTFQTPPHVDVGAPGAWQTISPPTPPLDAVGASTKVSWKNGAFSMSGWLVTPKDVRPGKKYPLIVYVHGGPGGAVTNGWTRRFPPLLASSGYFVFMPNPRGSFGFGEAFTQANRKDFGHGDLDDILKGVDDVLQKAPIDQKRIGIAGWSYGGFMAMFAPTQTQRFKAAVAGAGIANWESYAGQNHITTWMLPFYGASVYDAPDLYRKSSAIAFVKNAHTPTLILVGDRDAEVGPAQSYEWWRALRYFKVPSELVIYPGEGHRFRNRADARDICIRALAWFDKYLMH